MGTDDVFGLGGSEGLVAMRTENLLVCRVVRVGFVTCDEIFGVLGDEVGADVGGEGAMTDSAGDVLVVARAVPLVVTARAFHDSVGV